MNISGSRIGLNAVVTNSGRAKDVALLVLVVDYPAVTLRVGIKASAVVRRICA